MKLLFTTTLFTLFSFIMYAQQEKVVVEGAIVIADNEDPNPVAGTIRWTGSDFEGFDGTDWISLTCCDSGPTTVTDCSGNVYNTVKIGSQTWFATNLATSCYNDGSSIPFITDQASWQTSQTNATDGFTYFNFEPDNASGYGGMYNFYSIDPQTNGGKNVCPIGWHVPTTNDINLLEAELNGMSQVNIAGGRIKSNSPNWNMPNLGTHDSGFNAEPIEVYTGFSSTFFFGGTAAFYTSSGSSLPIYYRVVNDSESLFTAVHGNGPESLMCVRCIKD